MEGPLRQQGVVGTGDIGAVVGRAVHIQVSVSHARAPGVVEKGYSDIMGPAAPIALNQKLVRMTRGVERVSRLDAANLRAIDRDGVLGVTIKCVLADQQPKLIRATADGGDRTGRSARGGTAWRRSAGAGGSRRVNADVIYLRRDRHVGHARIVVWIVLRRKVSDHVHGPVHVARRRLRSDELPIDVKADRVLLPVHTISVKAAGLGKLAVDLQVVLPMHIRCGVSRVNPFINTLVEATVMLDDVEFLPMTRIVRVGDHMVGQQPERIPRACEIGIIRTYFKVAVRLREMALGSDQARLPAAWIARRGAVGYSSDRKDSILDAEWIVARRCVDERGSSEADVRVGIVPPLRADIGPGRGGTGLRNTATVELLIEGQRIAGQINYSHTSLLKEKNSKKHCEANWGSLLSILA